MKYNWKILKRYAPWLFLLLSIDGVSALILWLADVKAFYALVTVIILGTLLLFWILLGVIFYREKRREEAFLNFIHTPDEYNEEKLCKLSSEFENEMIRLLGCNLRKKQEEYNQLQVQISDYEEYVEAWAHEIKTPISLLTFLLDNWRDGLSESMEFKLDYIRSCIQESVNQMLFYARLKSAQKDYLFEMINLYECITEVLEDYRPLLDEKNFSVNVDVLNAFVYSDRRGLRFLICQVISNSFKYTKSNTQPELLIRFVHGTKRDMLYIMDNGMGVRGSDLPYIFEKGFTGNSGRDRKQATGMGLYLAKAVAYDLKITLKVESEWKKGFTMKILFPVI